jgi:hypothetical protein
MNNKGLCTHLEILLPAFGKLKIEQGKIFIDAANECLKATPFMYLLTGNGVIVTSRKQAIAFARATFDRPIESHH